jgi:hypothetical protein
MKNKVVIGFLTFATMLLVLTGWDKYSLNSLPVQTASFIKEEVIVTAKAYTADESELNLHKDLLSRGYRPIQVSVQNNSSKSFAFSAASVSLRLTNPKDVALKVSTESIPRAIAYKIASTLFWPLFFPSTVDSIKTLKAHQLMKRDFRAKSIKDVDEVITPYSTVTRVLFVKEKDFHEKFTVSLIDKDTKVLTNYRCNVAS